MNVNQVLKKARAESGLKTDSALANALGVSRAALSHWEDGTAMPTPENAVKLANLAKIEPGELVLEVLEETAKTDDLRSVIADWKRRLTAAVIVLAIALPGAIRAAHQCILCKIPPDRSLQSRSTE